MRTQHQSRRELDKIDRNILRILQEEGRISFTELGERVGLSTTPCTERVRRLEREGIIMGYNARLNPQYLKASHIKDADLDLHEKLADCFEHIGRRQEAIAEWKTCLEQAKDNPGASERARRALDRLRTPPSG